MIKKLILTSLIFVISCGYQPIYVNKSLKNIEFSKITIEGDKAVNRKIIDFLSIKENKLDDRLGELLIKSTYTIEELSKNSKGQVISYKSKIVVKLKIQLDEEIIKDINFDEDFVYNNRDNKFELVEYQNEIKKNIINKILDEIIIKLNV
tara:strand:- start:339 stop:788 length:450 start_codon:yes stop_codon:yes gene_type:complete